LGHPMRLAIMGLLQERELTVNEIADRLNANVTSVSKHLSLLRGLGIVRGRKVGPAAYRKLGMPQLIDFVGCVACRVSQQKSVMKQSLGVQEELTITRQVGHVSHPKANTQALNPGLKR
jgi:ArsR family transcriptional regulator, arsenate/arsenite/antimonite-responsive transcriptional repressor